MSYIPFTEEQKQTANNVELAEFLRMRGEKLERAGREYKLIYTDGGGKHDSITMSGNRWFDHNSAFACAAFGLMVNISRIIYDDYDREQRKLSSKVDRKLRNTILRKKQDLGLKGENSEIQ